MKEKNWQNVKEIFLAALEKTGGERAAFLSEIRDDEIRAEVESLLNSHEEIEDFIETPAFQVSEVFAGNGAHHTEKRFGNYKIVREIGAGGMGAVFLAERDDGEFSQKVAIKIIRQTIADREIINRFKRERQILANLNHPNIAKLLDGGVSASGEPFLAMEFIEGEAITKFAETQNLSLESRLRLFLKVCAAVKYAHRNLIVHRDLKPGNILVTDENEPKLLDFGLAKLVDDNLNNDSEQTQTAFRALTPAYASPEQIKGDALTTASDIYSLGVIFYELLTGMRPFQFEGKSLDEIIKTVTNSEPLAPSTNQKSKVKNQKSLKGDLDNIALTALRKEPERRYQSVEVFADDIERYLNGLPVSARPNTLKYRAEKYFKRHKIGVLAVSLVLLSLIGGIIASVWQARIAASERDQARREKTKAEQLNIFLQSMLSASNPDAKPSEREPTVKDILDEASKRLDSEDLSNQPEIKADLQRIIGISYLSLGQYDLAEQNINAAAQTQQKIYGENHPETLKTMILAVQVWMNRGENEKVVQFYDGKLSIIRSEYQKGTIHADYLITALHDLAIVKRSQSNSNEAELLLREALFMSSNASSEAKTGIEIMEAVLALTLADQGKFDEAIEIVRRKISVLRGQTVSGGLAGNLTGLGSFLNESGKFAEAEENLREAESIYRKLYEPTFLALGDNLRLQAQVLYAQGKYTEAEAKILETLEIYGKNTNSKYINFATALMIQGLILNKTGKSAEAEKILREAVEIREKNLPPEHFLTALAKSALGECLTTQKKFAEAEPLLTQSFESLKNSQGAENPRTILAQNRLNKLNELWKKL